MSTLTNSIRPSAAGKSISTAGPAYSAYKLRGICARCSSSSYQTANSGHHIFKMVCPDCKIYLTELKQKIMKRNAEAAAANLASKK